MIPVKVLLRRGTKAGGESSNCIPRDGEPLYETDTRKLKFGDGKTLYKDLPYFNESDDIKIDDVAHKKIVEWIESQYKDRPVGI